MGLLVGRTAVVTGAAQGLGLAIARRYLEEGAHVVLADVDEGHVAETVSHLDAGDRAAAAGCDVTRRDQVESTLRGAAERFGTLDIVVNNAGFARDKTMRRMSEEDFDSVIAVHLKGTWLGTVVASDLMREQGTGGSIINMSSISGKVGNPGQTNYSAAKAGIVGLTKAAAKEVGFAGIRVNALQPGLIHTAMTAAMSPEVLQSRLAEVPLGRFGEPEEVASVAAFLASDLASYLTGTVIEIAGGRNI